MLSIEEREYQKVMINTFGVFQIVIVKIVMDVMIFNLKSVIQLLLVIVILNLLKQLITADMILKKNFGITY